MHIVVVSGGTATNSLLSAFSQDSYSDKVTYILPVSDNGGSSSEILRVLGGSAIGDIRSRLVRLIQNEDLRNLFGHRLGKDSQAAKEEWRAIVDGEHEIWRNINTDLKTIIRTFLLYVDMEIKKRIDLHFRFEVASIGNMFLTGTRFFFGDFDAGVELLRRICKIPEQFQVYGVLNTNCTHNISAVLENGETVCGQSEISHPSAEGQGSQLHIDKKMEVSLGSKIEKITYISPYGEEITVPATEKCINAVESCDMIVYSIGSLYTSIIPVLLADGIGNAIINSKNGHKYKILLMNHSNDRETEGMSVFDYVKALLKATGATRITDVVTDIITTRYDQMSQLTESGVHSWHVSSEALTAENVHLTLQKIQQIQL